MPLRPFPIGWSRTIRPTTANSRRRPHVLRFARGYETSPCRIPRRPAVPILIAAHVTRAMVGSPDPPAVTRSGRGRGKGPEGCGTAGGSSGPPTEVAPRRSRRNARARRGIVDARLEQVGVMPEGRRRLVEMPMEGRTQVAARIDRRDARSDSPLKRGVGIPTATMSGLGGMVPAVVRITTGTVGRPASAFGAGRRTSRSRPASCGVWNGCPGRRPKHPGRIPCRRRARHLTHSATYPNRSPLTDSARESNEFAVPAGRLRPAAGPG